MSKMVPGLDSKSNGKDNETEDIWTLSKKLEDNFLEIENSQVATTLKLLNVCWALQKETALAALKGNNSC